MNAEIFDMGDTARTFSLTHPMGEGEQADICWKVQSSKGCRHDFYSGDKLNAFNEAHYAGTFVRRELLFPLPSDVRGPG